VTRLKLEAGTTFRSLRNRNFRLFFTGQFISQTGTWFEMIGITWLMLQLTGSGVALGMVTVARFGPLLILGPWGGVLSDRLDRHRLMLATQACFASLAAVEAVLVVTDHAGEAALYAITTVFGVLTAMDSPARRALVVELVGEDDVANAVGLNSALMTAARTIGPALAGLMIAGPGIKWCFVVNAISYLFVISALLRMDRSTFRSSPRVVKAKGQLVEGFRYVWRTPALMFPLLLATVIGTLAFNYQVTLPLLAERDLQGSAGTFTLLYSVMSLGSVAGALVVARQHRIGLRFLLIGGTGMAIFTGALTFAPTTALALASVLPLGFSSFMVISGSQAMAQVEADPAMRGRVLALFSMVFLGSTPVGGPIVGWISQSFSPRAGLAVGGIATALVVAWVARASRRRHEVGVEDEVGAEAGHLDELLVGAGHPGNGEGRQGAGQLGEDALDAAAHRRGNGAGVELSGVVGDGDRGGGRVGQGHVEPEVAAGALLQLDERVDVEDDLELGEPVGLADEGHAVAPEGQLAERCGAACVGPQDRGDLGA